MSEAFRNMRLKILAVSLAVQDCLSHFPEEGQERFENGGSGSLTANVSGGTSASGWMLSDNSAFVNGNEVNLTLTGLGNSSMLTGLSSQNASAVATNGGSLKLKLTGKGAKRDFARMD